MLKKWAESRSGLDGQRIWTRGHLAPVSPELRGEVPGEQRVPHNHSWTLRYLNSTRIPFHTPQPFRLPCPCTVEHRTKPLPFPPLGKSLQHPEHSMMSSGGGLQAHPSIPFQPPPPLDLSPPDLGRSCRPTAVPRWLATAFRDPANSSTFSPENYSPALTQRGWQPPPDLHERGMSGTS